VSALVNFVCFVTAGLAGCACVFVILCALGWPERSRTRRQGAVEAVSGFDPDGLAEIAAAHEAISRAYSDSEGGTR